MTKLYRIYTEDKKLPIIKSIVNKYFKGYTIIKTSGVWYNKSEKSVIIELIATSKDIKKVKTISQEIKAVNRQKAVLLTIRDINSQLV